MGVWAGACGGGVCGWVPVGVGCVGGCRWAWGLWAARQVWMKARRVGPSSRKVGAAVTSVGPVRLKAGSGTEKWERGRL